VRMFLISKWKEKYWKYKFQFEWNCEILSAIKIILELKMASIDISLSHCC
jgi:hypothetical protein